MERTFIPTHRIVFKAIGVSPEVVPVMLQAGEIWTQAEWDGMQPGQDWSNDHEWVVDGSDWLWLCDGLRYRPGNLIGKIHIEPVADSL
jgi:hypothetical protein